MSKIARDVLFSIRLLRRHPFESVLVVAALALGISLATAMFSILWGTVLRGLPYKDSDRLMRIEAFIGGERVTPTDVDFLSWRRRQDSFEGLAAFLGGSFNLSGPGITAVRANGAWISANAFQLVQTHPLLGREVSSADEARNAPPVAILGFQLWKNAFGGDPQVIGKRVKVNGDWAEVIGVMPEGFGFPLHQEIWLSLQFDAAPPPPGQERRLQVFGKVKRGTSLRKAAADLQANTAGQPNGGGALFRVTPYVTAYTEELQPALYLLFGSSIGLLLVVCANVGGLLAAQSTARIPELAIRSALGASRARLLAQLLTETSVLAAIALGLSLPLAAAATRAYVASQGGELLSFWMDVSLDTTVIAYAAGVTILVTFAAAAIPALHVTGPQLNEVLKKGAVVGAVAPPDYLKGFRLIGQFALSFALLAITGLMIRSLEQVGLLNFGHKPENVLTAQIDAPYATYPTPERQAQFFALLADRLASTLGKGRVAFVSSLPGGWASEAEIEIEGQPRLPETQMPKVPYLIVSQDYFSVLQVDAIQGRLMEASDRLESQPISIVNRSFARRYFGKVSPVGSRLRFTTPAGTGRWREIVGVVPDLVLGVATSQPSEGVYVPFLQAPSGWMGVLLRTPGRPASSISTLRKGVASLDPDVPIFWVATLQERVEEARLPLQSLMETLLTFGAAALFVSLLGIYGVTAQNVRLRKREMAIRLTVGSQRADLLWLILSKVFLQVIAGIVLGAVLSLASSRYVASLLFGVNAWSVSNFVTVGVLLTLTGSLACLIPFFAALKLRPADVLRGD
jgi:putative ABC transport system permease protein